MTISQLFLLAIQRTFYQRAQQGKLYYPDETKSEDDNLVKAIYNNCCVYGTFIEIMLLNSKRHLIDTPVEQYLKRREDRKKLKRFGSRRKTFIEVLADEGNLTKKDHNSAYVFNQILSKNKCIDIFKNTIIDGEKGLRIYDEKSEEDFVKIKKAKVEKQIIIDKLALLLKMKSV